MTLLELLVTLLASKNTTQENMVRKNGSVRSAPNVMLFNLIGKLILKLVALENIDVIVAPFSPGATVLSLTGLSVMHWLKKVQDTNQV